MFCYKNVGRPLVTTVSNGDRKDTDMKLLLIFAAILAFSLAEKEKKKAEALDDSQAEASAAIELMKEGADLNAAASTYNSYVPPSQRPPLWNSPNYVPQNTWFPQEPVKPIQPVQTSVPANVQNDYYGQHNQWTPPVTTPPTTTTPNSVIKNEQYFGDNGYYYYEYKLADGTWVREEGYYTDPKQTEESLVKKGWYSFVGADHKVYTVKYWADNSGYHAYGDHLPTPPPPPAQPTYPTQTPAPVYYPTKAPVYVPPQEATYAPPQPTYQPPQSNKPYYPPQQQYYPPQQNYFRQQPYNQV